MAAIGAFTFVLHSHLPYARKAGRWPHGEEWLHEAAMETYIPLLETLYDLRADGVPFRITIGITPILAEQLADEDVKDHFDQYLDDRIQAAKEDIELFSQEEPVNEQLVVLANWYVGVFERVKTAFDSRFQRDILGAFKQLQDEGLIEITTCAATHGYLPLMGNDSTINAQLRTGIRSYERFFNRKPTGIWLPECAYRPAYVTETGRKRPGIEHFLGENGLKVFFSETHTITGGQPVGVAGGDIIGPYGVIKRRYVIPASKSINVPERSATTFQPYYVFDTTDYPELNYSGVSVIGRNNSVGQQVWSAEWGYPGDFDYREFHRKAGSSGIQYWRITGAGIDLGHKDLYHPDWAEYKIDQHAEHFAHLVGDNLRSYAKETGKFGLVSANYDTELFGHWWFEGVEWLGKVLRHLADSGDVELTTASRHINLHPPSEVLNLPESSWGAGGTHFVWDNNDTHWMWAPIHEAEARMENLANEFTDPTPSEALVLAQTAREALLLESSDWPFLVTTGQAREYSIQRFSQHLERFNKLASSLEKGTPDDDLAAELWELDKVFGDIDYRDFRTYSG
ncbi:MAG: glycoside hydrolase family protein [Chloroflexi bacterium OLB15]|nr:MAG: glycoside hydrolase family protein [Chloroflexi bacterium OLB15]